MKKKRWDRVDAESQCGKWKLWEIGSWPRALLLRGCLFEGGADLILPKSWSDLIFGFFFQYMYRYVSVCQKSQIEKDPVSSLVIFTTFHCDGQCAVLE